MSYFARRQGRDWRRRGPIGSGWVLESLEGRKLLSGNGASIAASQSQVSSITTLRTSLKTAVAGARVTFSATVENASNDGPIASGKVEFVVDAPQKLVLGDVDVNKQGDASISTEKLTQIANYQVKAEYIPGIHTSPRASQLPLRSR